VRLERRAVFSASHRFWRGDWDAAANRRVFGDTASPHSHGHNYTLEVVVEGIPDSQTGMVMDLKRLKDVIAEVVEARFDHVDLNDDTPFFRDRPATAENLAAVICELLAPALAPQRLAEVRLSPRADLTVQAPGARSEPAASGVGQAPGARSEPVASGVGQAPGARSEPVASGVVQAPGARSEPAASGVGTACALIRVTRRYDFSAAHVLARPDWDAARNRAIYGKCANPAGHGHGYRLEVTVRGSVDAQSGRVLALERLDRVVGERVLELLDHRFLNREVPEFQSCVPTAENIARFAWAALDGQLAPATLDRIRLVETENNAVELAREDVAG
jgi:6-pyruvoyltetrahydropterin/6-carboxytetrahydropterin synthase